MSQLIVGFSGGYGLCSVRCLIPSPGHVQKLGHDLVPAGEIFGEGGDVTPPVLCQVIRSHEPTEADRALERLLPRVDLSVTAEFVGAGEALAAVFPGTVVRAFATVSSPMCSQMALLLVALAAAGLGTLVRPRAPGWSRRARQFLGRLIRTHRVSRSPDAS